MGYPRSLQGAPKLATPARKVTKDLPRSSAVRRGERPEPFRGPKTSHSVDDGVDMTLLAASRPV
jgi:hypothetical protein